MPMKIHEKIHSVYFDLATTAMSRNFLTLAERMFVAAVEEAKRPMHEVRVLARSWFGLAQVYHKQQKIRLALHYYQKAVGFFSKILTILLASSPRLWIIWPVSIFSMATWRNPGLFRAKRSVSMKNCLVRTVRFWHRAWCDLVIFIRSGKTSIKLWPIISERRP